MSLATIILAAGKGTRMKSDLAKVLHKINDKPLVQYVIDQAKSVQANPIILVVGHQREQVIAATVHNTVRSVVQAEQLGTGHAVNQAKNELKDFTGDVLILSGDVPLLSQKTIQVLLDEHQHKKAIASVLTAHLDDPTGYGRVLRNKDGHITAIVEHKDANEAELKINEINTGIYLINSKALFTALAKVKNNNSQNEYYLPDVLPMFIKNGETVVAYQTTNFDETRGINTVEQLKEAENILNAMAH